MSASAKAPKPVLVRVSTLLDLLASRQRSGAESAEVHLWQAAAELALQNLATALGDLDEQPLRLAVEERRGIS